jgi:hypothetical protein
MSLSIPTARLVQVLTVQYPVCLSYYRRSDGMKGGIAKEGESKSGSHRQVLSRARVA